MSREHLAERLGWSVSKLWRVETARSRAHHGDVVYLESGTSSLYLEDRPQTARYREVFDHLRAAASSPRESLAMIESVAADYGGGGTAR